MLISIYILSIWKVISILDIHSSSHLLTTHICFQVIAAQWKVTAAWRW